MIARHEVQFKGAKTEISLVLVPEGVVVASKLHEAINISHTTLFNPSLRHLTYNMLISLTVGKVDAGVAVLLTQDKRLVRTQSIQTGNVMPTECPN